MKVSPDINGVLTTDATFWLKSLEWIESENVWRSVVSFGQKTGPDAESIDFTVDIPGDTLQFSQTAIVIPLMIVTQILAKHMI